MANAWGENSWGAGEFAQQNDNTVYLTSVSDAPIAWNLNNFGSNFWGGYFPYIGLSLGDETTAGEINDGWGRLTWGENAWGGSGDVILSGNSLSLNINHGWGNFSWNTSDVQWGGITTINVAIGQQVNVTGLQLNTSLNSVTEVITVDAFVTTAGLLGTSVGEVDVSPDALVTGQQLNLSTGSVQAYNRQGWGRYYWGEEEWGADGLWEFVDVNNTNLGLKINSGITEYWGQDAWGASTTEWGGSFVIQTDISAIVEVSSVIMTIAEGEVDPGPDANVTGIGIAVSLSVGTVIAGDANTLVTGEQLNIAQGIAEGLPNTIASITGIRLNIAVGTVFAGGTSIIIPTGNGLTIALNSINNQIWTEINTGTDATWIEIDTAA